MPAWTIRDSGEKFTRSSSPNGIVVPAEITPLPPWSEDDLLEALNTTRDPLILALDGVQDPHNLGACLRTADACGALAVIVPKDRAVERLGGIVRGAREAAAR